MSAYEILIVVFTAIAIIVGILVEYIKNNRPSFENKAAILTN